MLCMSVYEWNDLEWYSTNLISGKCLINWKIFGSTKLYFTVKVTDLFDRTSHRFFFLCYQSRTGWLLFTFAGYCVEIPERSCRRIKKKEVARDKIMFIFIFFMARYYVGIPEGKKEVARHKFMFIFIFLWRGIV